MKRVKQQRREGAKPGEKKVAAYFRLTRLQQVRQSIDEDFLRAVISDRGETKTVRLAAQMRLDELERASR